MTQKIICDICGYDMNKSLNKRNHINLGIYKGVGEARYFSHLEWDLCIGCTAKIIDILVDYWEKNKR